MRFLHIADVHLDTSFENRSPQLRSRLRDASRTAFRRAVDLALREEVDALLIAGDLFDNDRLTLQTEGTLLRQLNRLRDAGVQVVYATGNHDPGGKGLRAHSLPWPDNVSAVTDGTPRRIEVRGRAGDLVGIVTAAGHFSSRETADLSRAFPAPEGALPEIALLHTQVKDALGAESHEPYAPSELSRLEGAGFDYWALGHVHLRQSLSDDPPIRYPGNAQGRNPRETGGKGGLLVEIAKGRSPTVEFRSLSPLRWEVLEVAGLSEVGTREALLGKARERWEEARAEDPGEPGSEWIVRVELVGGCPIRREVRGEEPEDLDAEFRRALQVLAAQVRTGRLAPVQRIADHRERDDILGTALRLLGGIRSGSEPFPGIRAEDLAGFRGEGEEELGAYIRSLMEGGEEEILDRMLDDGGAR